MDTVSTDVANVAESIVEEEEMATDIPSDETLFKVPKRKRNSDLLSIKAKGALVRFRF